MVNIMMGPEGSGKTKTMIQMANDAVKTSNGNVVCVEKGIQLNYDLNYQIRLVDIDQYGVNEYNALLGFLCGLMAGNYDITDIFVDSTLKIGGSDTDKLASFIEKLKELSDKTETNLVLSVSADKADIPARIAEFAVEI